MRRRLTFSGDNGYFLSLEMLHLFTKGSNRYFSLDDIDIILIFAGIFTVPFYSIWRTVVKKSGVAD